jgi:hypothetical protein
VRSRLAAAGVVLAWVLGSMALLFLFRGLPIRLRAMVVIVSLLLMILVLGWLKVARRE